jgi:hypothetical protein
MKSAVWKREWPLWLVGLGCVTGLFFAMRTLVAREPFDLFPSGVFGDDCRKERFFTDAELRERFRTHRGVFEALREMSLAEPGAFAIRREGPDDRAKMSPGRLAIYLTLLEAVAAKQVNAGNGHVDVLLCSCGMVVHGRSKSIEWSPRAPQSLVENTDENRGRRYLVSYARLEGNWYISHSSR